MEETRDARKLKLMVEDRRYSTWYFVDVETNDMVSLAQFPALTQISPMDQKMFSRDLFCVDADTVTLVHSYIKTCQSIAGVLQLDSNRTFGRTANKKRLLYKCIPDDRRLPAFLIPYEIRLGFSKVQTNKYVVFRFDSWTEKHPHGILIETLGDVDNLEVFYEYQLYCKSLHTSMTEFTSKTRMKLNERTNMDYIDQILKHPDFCIEDCRDRYVFTIDPANSLDFDDGFSIEPIDSGYRVTVYIANVFLWLETLGLWQSFSQRVATIYLPDRRRPMLPTILSDSLCSLQENQPRFALAMEFYLDMDGNSVPGSPFVYKNVLIRVSKNYAYEDPVMVETDSVYRTLFELSQRMDKSIKNSHDLVAFWMVEMNAYTGLKMASEEIGIFRSMAFVHPPNQSQEVEISGFNEETNRVIRNWNNTIGQYIIFDKHAYIDHEFMKPRTFASGNAKTMKSYIHITSPIRRLVDLLNQMILMRHLGTIRTMSDDATQFLCDWMGKMDYINTSMRSIRKIQTDCEVLNRCYSSPDIMEREYKGVVFDKIIKNDGSINYMAYLEDLRLLSRVVTYVDVPNYSSQSFRMFLFEDEDKVKKKIRLQFVL